MDQQHLEEFKQLLLQKKAEVEKDLGSVANVDKGDHVPGKYSAKFPNYGEENYLDGGSDSPDEVETYEGNLAVAGELEKHLQQIEAALQRIENGTYGKDIHTGEAISLDRLRANPAAETAIPKVTS